MSWLERLKRWLGMPSPEPQKFWADRPSHRNGFRLFEGRWASNLHEIDPNLPSAGLPMFKMDRRPRQAAANLGKSGRLDGASVLELGPLEGAHAYQLEQLGAASVLSIESNAEAFLRCLVVKNALPLDRTTFLLGDFVKYLESEDRRFDLIFACGILYHMVDPLGLIALIAQRTDKVYVFTAYYDAAFRFGWGASLPHRPVACARDGLEIEAYRLVYTNRMTRNFWGGVDSQALWMRLDDIFAAFRHYGFDDIQLIEIKNGPTGPVASFTAQRTRPAD